MGNLLSSKLNYNTPTGLRILDVLQVLSTIINGMLNFMYNCSDCSVSHISKL
jgi:hypothetical protein